MTAYQTQDPFSSDFFEIERQRGPRIPVVTIYYISQAQDTLFFP